MRAAILVVLLAACGGDEGAHDVVDCEWTQFASCERACEQMAGVAAGETCVTQHLGVSVTCTADQITVYNGDRGCCLAGPAPESTETVIRFSVCE